MRRLQELFASHFGFHRWPLGRCGRDAFECCVSALIYGYLTGLIVALGLSLGFYLIRPPSGAVPRERDVLDAFTWMDGKWYKQIAVEGYRYDPDARSNVAFYPAYPLLGWAVAKVSGLRIEVALLVVSNISLLAALAMLYIYARARYPDGSEELAEWVVLAAALFPTGCFFRFAYSESTFLLLALVAMYGMVSRWPLWATGLLVGLATAARPVGVALLAPFAVHVFRRASEADRRGRYAATAPLYLTLASWGLLAFMAYQYAVFGDALASFKVQRHWAIREPVSWTARTRALATLEPIRAVYDDGSPAFWALGDRHGIPWLSLQFANPLFFVGAVALVAAGAWRRWLTLEEAALAALLLFIPYVSRAYEMGMGSMGRFAAVVFPIDLVLGQILVRFPSAVRAALAALSGLFLALYAALYAAGFIIF